MNIRLTVLFIFLVALIKELLVHLHEDLESIVDQPTDCSARVNHIAKVIQPTKILSLQKLTIPNSY